MTHSGTFFGLFVLLLSASVAFAGIGPAATLEISNANVSPDGFTRAATVANGQVDGPLITGKKVSFWLNNLREILLNLPIIRATISNSPSSTSSMTTRCIRLLPLYVDTMTEILAVSHPSISTGTVSFKLVLRGLMV